MFSKYLLITLVRIWDWLYVQRVVWYSCRWNVLAILFNYYIRKRVQLF